MSVDFLLDAFEQYGARRALVWRDQIFSYDWLRTETLAFIDQLGLGDDPAGPGVVVGLRADYSPRSLAILLALLHRGAVVAPLTEAFGRNKDALFEIAEVRSEITVDARDEVTFRSIGHAVRHPLLEALARTQSGGLILFSSGSTGKSKAVVHDGERLLKKFRTPRNATVTIPFMLFDHIGGINTVLQVLSSGGTAVLAGDRDPATICRLIETYRVQVLPTSPTFVNLLLLSDHRSFDLSSLEIIAYGAERMPPASLARLAAAFPGVQLIQNYGLSETGIMRTQSEASDSLWMKLGGDGYQTRVRDGLLEIKAESAMLGYLNEVSPFTEDGWLKTGDRVEVKGEYLRILGRESDLIIIGGEKVYPAEVEDLIIAMPGVLDVVVSSEAHAITGQIVVAEVWLAGEESRADFRRRMTECLSDRLAAFKIPQKVLLAQEPLHNARFKKVRSSR